MNLVNAETSTVCILKTDTVMVTVPMLILQRMEMNHLFAVNPKSGDATILVIVVVEGLR